MRFIWRILVSRIRSSDRVTWINRENGGGDIGEVSRVAAVLARQNP